MTERGWLEVGNHLNLAVLKYCNMPLCPKSQSSCPFRFLQNLPTHQSRTPQSWPYVLLRAPKKKHISREKKKTQNTTWKRWVFAWSHRVCHWVKYWRWLMVDAHAFHMLCYCSSNVRFCLTYFMMQHVFGLICISKLQNRLVNAELLYRENCQVTVFFFKDIFWTDDYIGQTTDRKWVGRDY